MEGVETNGGESGAETASLADSATCQSFINQAPAEWAAAVRHPFLTACADGSISRSRFGRWIVQDHYFVVEFIRYAAHCLAKAPEEHFAVLLLGLESLRQEIIWFEVNGAQRGLDLMAPRSEAVKEYSRVLESYWDAPYPVHAAQLWAIEMAYNMGWRLPGPMRAPYNEFAERWGSDSFCKYVSALESQADKALESASPDVQAAAADACLEVARHERGFWDMASNPAEET